MPWSEELSTESTEAGSAGRYSPPTTAPSPGAREPRVDAVARAQPVERPHQLVEVAGREGLAHLALLDRSMVARVDHESV